MNPSFRAAVIAEWRGLSEPKTKPDRFESTGGLLPKILQRLGLKERLQEKDVMEAWGEIVGEFIAAHSAPVNLKQLAQETQLHPSTAHRILNVMVGKRLVDRVAPGVYSLGMRLFELGELARARINAQPIVDDLNRDPGNSR